MSLISTPNGDGTFTVTVDFPYYRTQRTAKYYQHYDQEGARAAAERFATRDSRGGLVLYEPQHQRYVAVLTREPR